MPSFARPVASYRGISSFWAHTHRSTPSREPGVDYYCSIGTPLLALADGYVAERGGSIYPATGRWTGLNFDNGWSARYLHASAWESNVGDRVRTFQRFGRSGASGYGSEYFGADSPNNAGMIAETGGPHVHLTLWPYHNGWNVNVGGGVDLEQYAGLSGAGQGDDMPDMNEIANTAIMTAPDGSNISLAQALTRILTNTHYIYDQTPSRVWGVGMEHTVARDPEGKPLVVTAGDLLRFEPAEHASTRAAVSQVATGDVDLDALTAKIAAAYPSLDVHALAVAAADEADRRERERLAQPTA